MRRFDHAWFNGFKSYAVSKRKYNREQALKIAGSEYAEWFGDKELTLEVTDAYVAHSSGWAEDNNETINWWIDSKKKPCSVPVWVFADHTGKIKEPGKTYVTV